MRPIWEWTESRNRSFCAALGSWLKVLFMISRVNLWPLIQQQYSGVYILSQISLSLSQLMTLLLSAMTHWRPALRASIKSTISCYKMLWNAISKLGTIVAPVSIEGIHKSQWLPGVIAGAARKSPSHWSWSQLARCVIIWVVSRWCPSPHHQRWWCKLLTSKNESGRQAGFSPE